MKLQSISTVHHKVLGSVKINLFADSVPIEQDSLRDKFTDLYIEVEKTKGENHYTYLIGQNGIGKTLLFKTLIHYVNTNSYEKSESLDQIIQLYSKSIKYRKLKSFDLSFAELDNLDIYNKYFRVIEEPKRRDFLEYHDSQLIFITSTFDKTLVNKNSRFRNFNYISEINSTKILFSLALLRFYGSDRINILNNLLNKGTINWSIECGLAYVGAGGIDDQTSTVLLKDENEINIVNFLSLLSRIKINDDGSLYKEGLNDEDLRIFEVIYNSGAFFKLFHNSNLSASSLFTKMLTGTIMSKISTFLKEQVDSKGIEDSLNVRIKDGVNWNFLSNEITELSEFDILFLALLENLNLVDIDVQCNGVQIERMSSGEQSILRLFSFFSDLPIPDKYENLIVFFDEPENSLHPQWQQNFPIYFKQIVEDVYQIKNSHFIFATHSPLIIMKSAFIKHSNVLQFSKDKTGSFVSSIISNINSFSIEEVLLDEFKISYRDKEIELKVENILKNKAAEITSNSDPINSIEKSFELKNKIDDLFNKINSSN